MALHLNRCVIRYRKTRRGSDKTDCAKTGVITRASSELLTHIPLEVLTASILLKVLLLNLLQQQLVIHRIPNEGSTNTSNAS